MPRISIPAIVIAFTAEIGADYLIFILMFAFFSQGLVTPETTTEQYKEVFKQVCDTTLFLPCMFMTGTATTLLGGYFAARIAKRIPYYHGLAMGIVGVVFSLVLWQDDSAIWLDYVGLITTIPVSIYGAHLAKKHMPVDT